MEKAVAIYSAAALSKRRSVTTWHLTVVAPHRSRSLRRRSMTEMFLALASDWAFMITKDSAADYARKRADGHFQRVAEPPHAGHEPAIADHHAYTCSRIPERACRSHWIGVLQ